MQGKKATKGDKKAFLGLLQKRRGIVTLACREAGINPVTFYRWQNSDPEFAQEADQIRDVEIGIIAEDRLAEAIIVKGDLNATSRARYAFKHGDKQTKREILRSIGSNLPAKKASSGVKISEWLPGTDSNRRPKR